MKNFKIYFQNLFLNLKAICQVKSLYKNRKSRCYNLVHFSSQYNIFYDHFVLFFLPNHPLQVFCQNLRGITMLLHTSDAGIISSRNLWIAFTNICPFFNKKGPSPFFFFFCHAKICLNCDQF